MKKVITISLFYVLVGCGNSEPTQDEITSFLKNIECENIASLDEHPTLIKKAKEFCNSKKLRETRYKKSSGKEW